MSAMSTNRQIPGNVLIILPKISQRGFIDARLKTLPVALTLWISCQFALGVVVRWDYKGYTLLQEVPRKGKG